MLLFQTSKMIKEKHHSNFQNTERETPKAIGENKKQMEIIHEIMSENSEYAEEEITPIKSKEKIWQLTED